MKKIEKFVLIFISVFSLSLVLTVLFGGELVYSWEEPRKEVQCLSFFRDQDRLVLFEIAGETIIVPESIVDRGNDTILVRMKAQPWREGYYRVNNAPVGGWVLQ